MTILMCRPEHYDVLYRINPWMNVAIKAEQGLASQQWDALYQTILSCGATVELIDHIEGWPDMVFTANAALVKNNKAYLAHFKHPQRQGERAYFKTWFEQHGFQVVGDEDLFFEGAGDGMFVGETLFAGFGHRSDKAVYPKIIDALDVTDIVYCNLIDDRFYHIDTCFCPLDEDRAMWWPGAFDEESQQRMMAAKELIAIPEEDAMRFAANSIVIGKHIVIPANCPATEKILHNLGFSTHACEMSEFLKAGGACKCLTLTVEL